MTTNETILSVIPGTEETQRLVVVLRSIQTKAKPPATCLGVYSPELAPAPETTGQPASSSQTFCEELIAVRDRPLVLRQQSFSPAVGWFTQSELEMTQEQWAMMRCTVVPAKPNRTAKNARFSRPEKLRATTSRNRGDGQTIGTPVLTIVPSSTEQAASA